MEKVKVFYKTDTQLRTELSAKKRKWYNNVLKWRGFFNRMNDITAELIDLEEDIKRLEREIYGDVSSKLTMEKEEI